MSETKPIALVTGSAGILGPAIVDLLAQEGWLVAATDRSVEERDLCEHLAGRKLKADTFIPADLSSRAAAETLVRQVESELGPITALINAATINFKRPFGELQEEEVQAEIAVNLLAPLWLAQAALPSLSASRGSIVNFSSIRASSPRRNTLIYSCTKAALEKATEVLAADLLEDGVRVNALRVGVVPGNHFMRQAARQLPPDQAAQMARDIGPTQLARSRAAVGANCVGTPEDIARWVAILTNPKNHFLNGEVITLDGGYLHKFPTAETSKVNVDLIQEWLNSHD